MAIIELAPNLYPLGDFGSFENGEVEDFGYLNTTYYALTKSTEQTFEGDYSLKSVVVLDDSGGQFQRLLVEDGTFKLAELKADSTYIIRARVYLPFGVGINPPGTAGSKVIVTGPFNASHTPIERVDATIGISTEDVWTEISYKFQSIAAGEYNFNFILGVGASWGASGAVNVGGVVYFDKIELHQIIDEDEIEIETVFGKNPIPISTSSNDIQGLTTSVKYETTVYLKSLTEDKFEELIACKGFPSLENGGPYTWNFKSSLLATLSPDLPSYNQAAITFGSKSLRRFFASIKEYGTNHIETNAFKRITLTDITDVLLGGLSFIDWPGNTFFSDNVPNQGQFLTWAPATKTVSPGQQEYLYFMTHKQDYDTLYLHCKITFSDGSTQTISPLNAPGAANKICIIPVGYSQLGLGLVDPEKTVKKFSVWVNKSNNPAAAENKSQERTFVLDWNYYKYIRYFLFQNSLGAMEVLRCTGKFEVGIDLNRQEGSTILGTDYQATDYENFFYNSSYQTPIKGSSGIINSEWKEYLTEFIISDNIFEFYKGRFIKIRPTKDKSELIKDFEPMNSITLEYTYAHSNSAYSK